MAANRRGTSDARRRRDDLAWPAEGRILQSVESPRRAAARLAPLPVSVSMLMLVMMRLPGAAQQPIGPAGPAGPAGPDIRPAIARLVSAYPDHLCDARDNAVVFCDGDSMVFDDGKPKTFAEKLAGADLEDQLAQAYPTGPSTAPARDFDPGRARATAFFEKVYGDSPTAVKRRLTRVAWLPHLSGRGLHVTRINGVDHRLRAVARAIAVLPRSSQQAVAQSAGGFKWRSIRGEQRRSMHSFGIAVDVGGGHADYWRWRKLDPAGLIPYRNRIPLDVVAAFERHGFIWGGRWYHYDTMHFEYRPELLPARDP